MRLCPCPSRLTPIVVLLVQLDVAVLFGGGLGRADDSQAGRLRALRRRVQRRRSRNGRQSRAQPRGLGMDRRRTRRSSIVPTRSSRRSTTSAGGRFASTSARRPTASCSPSSSRPSATPGRSTRSRAPLGHQLAEGRWLRDRQLLDDYTRFWFRSGEGGGPAAHFHKFSSWAAAAIYDRYLVTRRPRSSSSACSTT